jgi:small subunit ribosomal protein S6
MEANRTVTLYETLFIVHPDKVPRVKEFIEKFKKVVEGLDGTIAHVDEWGLRDLAYRIDKQSRGFYTLLQFRSTARAVDELERNMRLTDGILRYLTVRANEESATREPQAVKNPAKEPGKPPEEDIGKSEPRP